MSKPTGVEKMNKDQLLYLLARVRECFQNYYLQKGDESTSVFFYNTDNKVNTYVNISHKSLDEFKIDLKEVLK